MPIVLDRIGGYGYSIDFIAGTVSKKPKRETYAPRRACFVIVLFRLRPMTQFGKHVRTLPSCTQTEELQIRTDKHDSFKIYRNGRGTMHENHRRANRISILSQSKPHTSSKIKAKHVACAHILCLSSPFEDSGVQNSQMPLGGDGVD